MSSEVIDAVAFPGGILHAAILVSVTAGWLAFRRTPIGRTWLQHYTLTFAILDIALIPAALFAFGNLLHDGLLKLDQQRLAEFVAGAFPLLIVLAAAIGVGRILEVLILNRRSKAGLIRTALPNLFRLILYGLCLFAGLVVYLSVNGYRPTELYLSTGALAAILAFAMQQTLGDFFSGLALSLEGPFKSGDWIILDDGREGEVIDINWRSTHMRGWDNATHVIPNSLLARHAFKNMHDHKHYFAPWYEIRIPNEVDPRAMNVLLLEAALRCKRILQDPLPVVRLMDARTAPYTYMVWVHFPNYPAMFAGREELFREIHSSLESAGLSVAVEMQEIRHRRSQPAQLEVPNVLMALKLIGIGNILTEDELEQVARMSRSAYYDVGTVIVEEDEISDSFYIVTSGVVDATIEWGRNKRKSVERLKTGDYFGIVSMLTADPSMMQFSATTEVSVIRIDIECLRSVISLRPNLAEQLTEIVQRRRKRVEDAKMETRDTFVLLTFQDLLRKVELALRHPGSGHRKH